MKYLTFLLFWGVCAVAFTKDLRERRSSTTLDAAMVEDLIRDVEDGKVDLNELLDKRDNNQYKRLYFPLPIRWDGKR
ncbi:hypothetical protein CHS0354_033398 [Potamilus streckersoni]|uniref:Uncharacterized protein n=1 Tax=Potamilus streckersoni TaxID=2493646 RepID=A0AAE0SQT5_9BIVA|nr:hypothetical protein CHS0354_033398 [Potamilus streckersoni]